MLPFYVFWHAMLTKNNPCVPLFVGFWVQRCFFGFLGPILLYVGRCCMCCKAKTKTTYSDMNPPVVVAEDAEAGFKVFFVFASFLRLLVFAFFFFCFLFSCSSFLRLNYLKFFFLLTLLSLLSFSSLLYPQMQT